MTSSSTPFWPSTTIQLVVRTRSEVQNGSSTMMMSRFEMRWGRVASRYDTG
jgi:hypothetical protein